MHYVTYFLIPREDAEEPEEAKTVVRRTLEEHHWAGEATMFVSPPADYFRIGGRWEGELGNQNEPDIDAKVVDEYVWQNFIKDSMVSRKEAKTDSSGCAVFLTYNVDVEYEKPDKGDVVGNFWCVVVDSHI